MQPDQVYDKEGVFSGSSLASGFQGLPTIMYTAVSQLPISWKSDYNRGSEKQALAISHDGGHSWEKMSSNPVISAPPLDVNVSGWRDPYLFRSDTFEEAYAASRPVLTHADSKAVFATISGGDKDAVTRGGRLFLYRSTDFVSWAYVGILFASKAEDNVGGSSAHFGLNFEVANVFSIPVATTLDLLDRDKVQDSDSSHDLERLFHIVVGSEGARYENGKEVHDTHWPLWASGKIVPDSIHGVKFEMISSGVADWGTYYAANSFEDPRTKRRLIFGWSNDENEAIRKAQGWGGILTMPREHIVVNYHRVTNFKSLAYRGALTVVASEMKNGKRMDMLRTLGSRPIQEMTRLRQNWFVPNTPLTTLGSTHRYQDIGYTGAHYEIHAQFQFPLVLDKGRYGFVVRASTDGQERTVIYFDLGMKRIIVNKSRTSSNKSIDARSEWGNFELLTILNAVGEEERETLDLRIFVDNSIIEVSRLLVYILCISNNRMPRYLPMTDLP
jgi:beta-fructofuranosidase